MKRITAFILFNSLMSFSIHSYAQDIENQKNPFHQPHINYFKQTVMVFNEYLERNKGSFNTTDVRVILPIGNNSWNLRADVPLVSTSTDGINKTGLGNISVGAAYIPYINAIRGIALRGRVFANSATDSNFSTGKWVIAPAVYYAQFIDEKKEYLWIPSVEYLVSFAGSSNRSTVNTTLFENLLLHYFGKNWIGADIAFRYNATLNGYQNNAYLEFGRRFSTDTMFYVHPSVAFGGEKTYNKGMEVGMLVYF